MKSFDQDSNKTPGCGVSSDFSFPAIISRTSTAILDATVDLLGRVAWQMMIKYEKKYISIENNSSIFYLWFIAGRRHRDIRHINKTYKKYLGIETLNPSEHVTIFHRLNWHRGSTDPQGQHFVALFLLRPSPVLASLNQTLWRIDT